jgi:hypothetical protein
MYTPCLGAMHAASNPQAIQPIADVATSAMPPSIYLCPRCMACHCKYGMCVKKLDPPPCLSGHALQHVCQGTVPHTSMCALPRLGCITLQSNMTSTAVSSTVMSKLQRNHCCPCKRQDPGWLAGSTCSTAPTPNCELHVHRSQHVLACTLPQPAPNQNLFYVHPPPPPTHTHPHHHHHSKYAQQPTSCC